MNVDFDGSTVVRLQLKPMILYCHFFRFKSNSTVRLQARQRFSTVFASNSTPSGGDSLQEKSDTKASDAGQGPPFLTILAGFVVFVLVCWIVGSIVMWLTGLIVQLLKS